jgi:hypothetical protein
VTAGGREIKVAMLPFRRRVCRLYGENCRETLELHASPLVATAVMLC